jgi:hypothetical protein
MDQRRVNATDERRRWRRYRPPAPNKLVGTLAQPLGNGVCVVVSVTMADGQALQARFLKN